MRAGAAMGAPCVDDAAAYGPDAAVRVRWTRHGSFFERPRQFLVQARQTCAYGAVTLDVRVAPKVGGGRTRSPTSRWSASSKRHAENIPKGVQLRRPERD